MVLIMFMTALASIAPLQESRSNARDDNYLPKDERLGGARGFKRLDSKQIYAAVNGREVIPDFSMANGASQFSEAFLHGGKVSRWINNRQMTNYVGTWTIREDMLCVSYRNVPEKCRFVFLSDDGKSILFQERTEFGIVEYNMLFR